MKAALQNMSDESVRILDNPEGFFPDGDSWIASKSADRAPLPTDPEGMQSVAESYAKQMEQVGLPIHDQFWDSYKEFEYARQIEDLQYMQISLDSMARRVPNIMGNLDFYINQEAPTISQGKEAPDLMTSVQPWDISGLTFDKMKEGVDQAVVSWEEDVNPREVDPYSVFWDDVAAFQEAFELEDYDNAQLMYDKIVNFKDNYAEAQDLSDEPSEAESMDFKKMVSKTKEAVPVRRRGPGKRQDRTLTLLEEILGKPVKNLYDEEGDISDMGDSWDDQDLDFLTKGPSKVDEGVFEVEVEDEPEVDEEFVPEKKEVDPFSLED
jgi:hypothetical protein